MCVAALQWPNKQCAIANVGMEGRIMVCHAGIQRRSSGGVRAQVGALGAAKDALREVVQLPLQHPGLFAHGSLARPTKGVLLFGPPGERLLPSAFKISC